MLRFAWLALLVLVLAVSGPNPSAAQEPYLQVIRLSRAMDSPECARSREVLLDWASTAPPAEWSGQFAALIDLFEANPQVAAQLHCAGPAAIAQAAPARQAAATRSPTAAEEASRVADAPPPGPAAAPAALPDVAAAPPDPPGDGNEADENGEDEDGGEEVEAKPTFKSDYNAKHFSLMVGAVVLNPFEIESIDDMDPSTARFRVGNGTTEANFLVEAGFRRRWAWEDWTSEGKLSIKRKLEAQESLRDSALAADQGDIANNAILQIAKLQRDLEAIQPSRRYDDLTAGFAWQIPDARPPWYVLVPDNYLVRLGFALGSDTPSGAASIAGAGDFYVEAGLGWDLFRFLYPAGDVPLRVAFGPEVLFSANNDKDLDDFHSRYAVGAGVSVGLPFEDRTTEMLVRIAAVNVEIPDFLDGSTREITVSNEVAKFASQWGLGVDVEFNVPISEELGYLFLRGTTNHGMDPNPWSATVGYTLPMQSILGWIRQ